MQVTRRYWAAVGLAGLLAAAGVVLAHPMLLAGAGGLGAWLLARQYFFARAVERLDDGVSVEQTLSRDRIVVEEAVTAELLVRTSARPRLPVELTVEAGVPLGAAAGSRAARRCRLERGEREAAAAFEVEWPVAGRVEFESPTATVTDESGLFRSTFPVADTSPPAVTVLPEQPRALHVGAGGESAAAVLGDHATDQEGAGIEPASIREYVPGDALRQIDWKATARSDDLYVRTYTQQVEYETALVVDHRSGMRTGTASETKLEYARQVALAVVEQSRSNGDAVGLYGVGDGGITERRPPGSTPETYAALRTALHDLAPTDPTAVGGPAGTGSATGGPETESAATAEAEGDDVATTTPRSARRAAAALDRTDSAFAASLRPFYAAAQTYVERIAAEPFYRTVRDAVGTGEETERGRRPNRAVLVTDDADRPEVREAVKAARHRSDHVLVFLTPTVLFEPDGLTDIERAYERYTDFEEFRRHLEQFGDVSAFEVAPGDRLSAVQSAAPTDVPSL